MRLEIRSQAELEDALARHGADPHATLVLLGPPDEVLRVSRRTEATLTAAEGRIEVAGDAQLSANGTAVVNARADAVIFASGFARVLGCGTASIALFERASANLADGTGAARFSAHSYVTHDPDAARRLVAQLPPHGWAYIAGPRTDATYLAYDTGQVWNGEAQYAFDATELTRFIANGDGVDANGEGLEVHAEEGFVDVADQWAVPLESLTVDGRTLWVPDGRLWDPAGHGDVEPSGLPVPGSPTLTGPDGGTLPPAQQGPHL